MRRLGYHRYGVQGGDMGALVSPDLGRVDAEHVIGIHVNAATAGFIPFTATAYSPTSPSTGSPPPPAPPPTSTTTTCTPANGPPAPTSPTGVAAFAEDIPIRRYAEQTNTITHWTDFDTGGHFAALETPDLLVTDMRQFSRGLR